MNIRHIHAGDLPAIGTIADATELFPSEMVPDLTGDFLDDGPAQDIWLACERDGATVGFCYAVPEQLAEGTWNMLAIGVLPSEQGNGIGGEMTSHLEEELRRRGARLLLADTSGTDGFARTRAFYAGRGYANEARIRDFWADGDDKVTFRKAL